MGLLIASVLVLGACSGGSGGNGDGADAGNGSDEEARVVVYFFWGDGCPHCETQKPFLEEMKAKYPGLVVKSFETWGDQANADMLQDMARAYNTQARGVPATFIGDHEPMIGFAASMEAEMEARIKACWDDGCVDPGTKI